MVKPIVSASTEMLKEVKLFQVFSDSELSGILSFGESQHFDAYANIVIEGEPSWGIYLILSGTVGILKTNKMSGNTYDVGQLEQGSVFGEMSLVDENPRSATVRALTDCQVFYISKEKFMEFLERSQQLKMKFYETCINTLVFRLRELNDSYVISQYQLWQSALKEKKEAS